ENEIAVLLELDAAGIVELLSRRLEEPDALLTEPDIEIQPPLHAEARAMPSRCAARELAFVDHQDARPGATLRHPPGAGEPVGAGADDQHVEFSTAHVGLRRASAVNDTGRAIGRGVI